MYTLRPLAHEKLPWQVTQAALGFAKLHGALQLGVQHCSYAQLS